MADVDGPSPERDVPAGGADGPPTGAGTPLREAPGHFLRGVAMGAANLVPGVSGGTVALVLAVYRRLIDAIRTGAAALGLLLRGDLRGGLARLRAVDWVFLLPLALGVLSAIVVLASAIEQALEANPVPMSGLFLGLVAGSVVVTFRLVPDLRVAELLLIAGTAAGFFLLLGVTAEPAHEHAMAVDIPLWQFFLAGAIAVCSMVLPALSGSFVLILLGMYEPLLHAVTERDYLTLLVVILGGVIGLALFSQLLHWLLAEHYGPFMALMLGLMIGSLRLLWPWPDGVASAELGAPNGQVPVTLLALGLGFAVVLAVDGMAHQLERRGPADEASDLRAV